jgi:hypothetical protein
VQRERHSAEKDILVEERESSTQPRAEAMQRRAEIASAMQFLVYPRFTDCSRVRYGFTLGRVAPLQFGEDALDLIAGQHVNQKDENMPNKL